MKSFGTMSFLFTALTPPSDHTMKPPGASNKTMPLKLDKDKDKEEERQRNTPAWLGQWKSLQSSYWMSIMNIFLNQREQFSFMLKIWLQGRVLDYMGTDAKLKMKKMGSL